MDQQPQAEYGYSKKQIALAMTAAFAVYGLMTYFVQALNIARPKMAAELNGMSLYSWSVSLPALTSAFVTLIFGKFSDMYGRRLILMIALAFTFLGAVLCAISRNFQFLIVASVIGAIGSGSMMPLVFAIVGDVFAPAERGKWIGLLNIPTLVFAIVAPILGGLVTDYLSWRWIYWISLPMLAFCLIVVQIGVPALQKKNPGKIDWLGCFLVGVASSTLIIGFSFAGTRYPWASREVVGLLGVSFLFWVLFILAETKVKDAVLDPLVFRNRSFLTIASATMFSFFGQVALMMYFPVFLQALQGVSATMSSLVIIAYSALMSLIGVPVGFLLTRSKRYKWMYILGFGLLTVDMFAIVFFSEKTPIFLEVLAATIAGIGLGAIPTVNTLVVQNVMPKRLLGAAMGAIFFCILMGVAISPAILGSAHDVAYAKNLEKFLPPEVKKMSEKGEVKGLQDSGVLLSETSMKELEKSFQSGESGGQELFRKTVQAIRDSLAAGLRSAFWVGAVTMLVSFLLILTLPEVSLDPGAADSRK